MLINAPPIFEMVNRETKDTITISIKSIIATFIFGGFHFLWRGFWRDGLIYFGLNLIILAFAPSPVLKVIGEWGLNGIMAYFTIRILEQNYREMGYIRK